MMLRLAGTLLALAATIAWPAFANDYPNKPIKVISDSAPGSAVDVTFRMVMDRLGSALGQQIVPIDQPGAGGAIAAHAAAESIPDGYTLFAPALSLFIALPGKADNLPLILPRDFLPVGLLAQLSVFICSSLQSGIKTLPDLIARAKERFAAGGWQGIVAPLGTPAAAIQKINENLRTVLGEPDLARQPALRGAYVDPMSPAEVNRFINAQQEQWRPVLETFEASIKK